MAFREIDPGPAPVVPDNTKKFEAVGDKFAGLFVSFASRTHDFGQGDRVLNEYIFKDKTGAIVQITANYDLHRRLQKADLKPGYKVIITYASDLPPKKAGHSPMKQFKVLVDDGADAAPPPPPKPAVSDDDLPF